MVGSACEPWWPRRAVGRHWPSQVASVLSRRTGALRLPTPGTATEQSLFPFSRRLRAGGLSLGKSLCRRWPSCLGTGEKTRQAALVAPPPRLLFGRVTVSSLSNRPCSSASTKRPHTSRSLAQQSSRPSVWDTTLQPNEAESSLRPPTALPRAPLRGQLSLHCHFAFFTPFILDAPKTGPSESHRKRQR